MTNEIVKIEDISEKIINELQIPKTDADLIVNSFSEIVERMINVEKELVIFNQNTEINKEVCNNARELRLKLVKIRTKNDEIHADNKAGLLLRTRAIDGVRNIFKLKIVEREEKLKEIETHFERIEEEKREKIRIEREYKLSQYVQDVSFYNLKEMSEAGFQELLSTSKIAFEAKLETEKKAEEERLKKEKEEAEAREKMRIENEKLKAEAEAREKELAKERDEQKKKLEAEKKKAEIEKQKFEAKLKAEAEAREKLEKEKAEQEKLEREKLLAEEKQRKEDEKAPDKEKILAYSNAIASVQVPRCQSFEMQEILEKCEHKIREACQEMCKSIEK